MKKKRRLLGQRVKRIPKLLAEEKILWIRESSFRSIHTPSERSARLPLALLHQLAVLTNRFLTETWEADDAAGESLVRRREVNGEDLPSFSNQTNVDRVMCLLGRRHLDPVMRYVNRVNWNALR